MKSHQQNRMTATRHRDGTNCCCIDANAESKNDSSGRRLRVPSTSYMYSSLYILRSTKYMICSKDKGTSRHHPTPINQQGKRAIVFDSLTTTAYDRSQLTGVSPFLKPIVSKPFSILT